MTGIIHCSAAKAIIQDSAGRVLLLREASTNPDGTNPGRWGVPGGRLEPGESAELALLREVAEETGLAVVVGAKVHRGSWHPTPVCTITGSFFACAAPDGQSVELSDEHDRYCWADRDMLERLDVMEPDRTAVVNVLAGHVEMSVEDQPRNELRDVRNDLERRIAELEEWKRRCEVEDDRRYFDALEARERKQP